MKTVFCPECRAALKLVYGGEKFFGWKKCNSCQNPVYVAVPEGGSPSAESLRAIVRKVSSHKPGVDALKFLVEHDEAFIDDLLFVAGRASLADIELLEAMHVVDRRLKTYTLKPVLKPYVEELVAPLLKNV